MPLSHASLLAAAPRLCCSMGTASYILTGTETAMKVGAGLSLFTRG